MLKSLTSLSGNLSFKKKTTVENAFHQIALEANFPALTAHGMLDDWVQTNAIRLRMACRHVAKAKAHKPSPQWLLHIFPMEEKADPALG
eukprot:1887990-Heterocapsa_arctica.AAC.1